MLDRTEAAGVSSTLVGRADELALLAECAGAARDGRSGLVLVSGPTGIGKTSLLRAFRDGGACHGMTVLHAPCCEVVAATGYGAVRRLFAPLRLAENPESPLLRGSARRALPALGDRPAPEDAGAATYPVLHGLYWLVVNLVTDRPLVLMIDDVHWCDGRSLRWVEFLLRRADRLPLLVVLARRAEQAPAAPAALRDVLADPRLVELPLPPLGEPEVAELARRAFTAPVAVPFVRRVAVVSGGNPLTLARLLHELRDGGVRPDAQGAQRVDEIGGQVVAGRVRGWLDRQPDDVTAVATAIAVAGPEPPEFLAALAGVSPAVLHDAVAVLRRAELVAPRHLDLVHDLVRAAVLDRLDAAAVGRWRVRAALLLSDAGRPADEVANQVLLVPALEAPWMVAVLRDAAAQAAGRGAPESAARYLYRVLEAEPDSVGVRRQLAGALAEFDPAEALRLLDEALARCPDARTRTAIAVQYGVTCLPVQRSPDAVRVLTGALDDLAAEPDPHPADRELRTLAEATLMIVGADEKSTIAAVRERAARLPTPPGDTPAQRQMLAMGGVLAAMDGRDRARVVEAARRAVRPPNTDLGAWVLLPATLVLHLADEVRDALDVLDRVLAGAQRNAAVWTYVLALATRSRVLHGLGAVADALADAQTALEITGDERWGAGMSTPQIALATALVERGQPDRAARVLARITRPNLDRFVWEYHWYLVAHGRVRWALGDRERALRLFLDCGRSLRECGLVNPAYTRWWVHAACLLAELRRPAEAREIVEQAGELADRWGTSRVRGLAALARGVISPGRAGVDHLIEAVDELSGSPARLDHAQAEYLLGAALLGLDDHRGAREHLRTAVDGARRCGALPLAGAARSALVAAGGRMREIAASPVAMLTGMERRVAALAAAGQSNRTIAESLFVTVRTVETHLTSVYRKLGVLRRGELATALGAVPQDRTAGDARPPEWVLASRGRR
ncbi:helix-turn-helix transcriptional regulator [Gandjariella thermophila]|uniref:HTH luxR-type domain-containing protein n=1 Tax=Gandjariella thermophila TaxID=1931992 RepID=A0A4D4J5P0_9PSEU|nr:LuxR family transcriptional regulator [Gandjariella thermophila]GDY29816.1 hypothetical protein GTS_14490 [Gandjariella thermophila]